MDDAPAMNPGARPAGRRRFFPAVLVGGVFALALVRLARLVQACAVNLPFQDQWDLLKPLFNDAGPWAGFDLQHGPHRQGLGGLINWFVYRGTAWDVRAEAWVATVILALAAISAVVLARRVRGRLSWSDAAFPLLLMATVNWETMLLTPNISHGILPLLLTIWLALAWTVQGVALRTGLLVGLGFLAVFTGFAACAFIVCVGLALLRAVRPPGSSEAGRSGWRWLVLAGFAVAVVLFARGYTWQPAIPNWRFPVDNLWDYPRFMALMYANLVGWREISASSVLLGGAILALVVATFFWALQGAWQDKPGAAPVLVLTGTSLVFGAFTAIGRVPAGIEAAFMWRYLPLLMPAIVGVAFALEQWLSTGRTPGLRPWPGVAVLGLALVVWGNFTPDRYAAIVAGGKREWIRVYLATHDLAKANLLSDFFVYRGDPESAMVAGRLRWLEQRRLTFFKDEPPPAAP